MHISEIERLIVLMEECAEVIQSCSKALRFGWDSTCPGTEETNREGLEREIHDLLGVVFGMVETGDIHCDWRGGGLVSWSEKQKYLKHQDF